MVDSMPGMDCCGGGGPSNKVQKFPDLIETCEDDQIFEEGGIYYTVQEKQNMLLLGVMFVGAVSLMFALMCINHWPTWVIDYLYTGGLKLAYPVLGLFYGRVLIWYIFYHIGFTFWILPNYTYPQQMFSPLFQTDCNINFTEINFFLPRVISLGTLFIGNNKLLEYIYSRIAYRGKNETV